MSKYKITSLSDSSSEIEVTKKFKITDDKDQTVLEFTVSNAKPSALEENYNVINNLDQFPIELSMLKANIKLCLSNNEHLSLEPFLALEEEKLSIKFENKNFNPKNPAILEILSTEITAHLANDEVLKDKYVGPLESKFSSKFSNRDLF
ncbi:MAG: hypothetical protein J0H68_00165 [Sphingobacteriia bacterium]|nr:hypothetical protein [Sphingobacteriia bacterium]